MTYASQSEHLIEFPDGQFARTHLLDLIVLSMKETVAEEVVKMEPTSQHGGGPLTFSQEPITSSQLELIMNPLSIPITLSQVVEPPGGGSSHLDPLLATQTLGSQSLQREMEKALKESTASGKRPMENSTSHLARAAIANSALKLESRLHIEPLDLRMNLEPEHGTLTDAAEAAALPLSKSATEQLLTATTNSHVLPPLSALPSPAAVAAAAAAATAAAAAAAAGQGHPALMLAGMPQQQQQQQQHVLALDYLQQQYQHYGAYAMQPMRHASVTKLEHRGSVAKRRGPMDEMRQLQRILTKLLPASASFMPAGTDGGGNKVQADQIKIYLAATLGEAPKPDWGLKLGWGQYLADLFNWATGRSDISNFQAMECARRQQGRSWEVLYDNLMALGIYSWNWELPLKLDQVLSCEKRPPPELQRQQEALAAATAAAAAAAAGSGGGSGHVSSPLGKRPAAASPTRSSCQKPGALMVPAAAAAAAEEEEEDDARRASKVMRLTELPTSPAAAGAGADGVTAVAGTAQAAGSPAKAAAAAAAAEAVPTVAVPSRAAAAAAAAAAVAGRLELPSQADLNAASCLQLLDALVRLFQGATQSVKLKQAGALDAEGAHAWVAALSQLHVLNQAFAQFFNSVQGYVGQQSTKQPLQQQPQQQPSLAEPSIIAAAPQQKQLAESKPGKSPAAATTAAAAAVVAKAAGNSTFVAGHGAAGGGGNSSQLSYLSPNALQQLLQLARTGSPALQQLQQSQQLLAAVAAAAASTSGTGGAAAGSQQQQQQQQQVTLNAAAAAVAAGHAVPVVAAHPAPLLVAAPAVHDDEEGGEELSLPYTATAGAYSSGAVPMEEDEDAHVRLAAVCSPAAAITAALTSHPSAAAAAAGSRSGNAVCAGMPAAAGVGKAAGAGIGDVLLGQQQQQQLGVGQAGDGGGGRTEAGAEGDGTATAGAKVAASAAVADDGMTAEDAALMLTSMSQQQYDAADS